jgi:WD40 repeat protein
MGEKIATMPVQRNATEHSGIISGLGFAPSGQLLASASHDHSIRLWDFPARKKLDVLQGHLNEVMAVAFSPDGTRFASAGLDNTVRLWDAKNGQSIVVLEGLTPRTQVAFSPNGQEIVIAYGGTLHALNATTGAVTPSSFAVSFS